MKNILVLICSVAISLTTTLANAELYNVGTRKDGAPYIEIDSNGIPDGFDIDVIKAIAKDQGFDINVRITDFQELLPRVDSGEFDLVIGGITITDERKNAYDFSDSYFQDYIASLTIDPSLNVSSIDDVIQLRMVLERGTLPVKKFEELGVNPRLADSVFLGIKAVAQGKADVLVHQEYVMRHATKQYQGVDFHLLRQGTGDLFPELKQGIAVKKGNTELLNKINQGLANIKGNGVLDQIRDKWDMN